MKRAGLIFLFSFLSFSFIPQSEVSEYNLKAVFIFNFTKYITWESSKQGNEFIIGVVGSSPIMEPLQEIAKTKTVNNRKIVVRQFRNPQDITYCNILFISKRNSYSINSILLQVNPGTLTIGEDEGLANEGVALNFIIEESKLKFEANLKAISHAGLKASSDLLQHAIIVD